MKSDVSFNESKMIDGYQDFVVTMQKLIANCAEDEDKDKKQDNAKGNVTQRSKSTMKKTD